MFGKMSVGVRTAAVTPKMTISIAITTNVYGLFSAMRTIASIELFDTVPCRCDCPTPVKAQIAAALRRRASR